MTMLTQLRYLKQLYSDALRVMVSVGWAFLGVRSGKSLAGEAKNYSWRQWVSIAIAALVLFGLLVRGLVAIALAYFA